MTAVATLTSSPLRVEADVPPVPAAAPFNARLCGSTTTVVGTVAGLLLVLLGGLLVIATVRRRRAKM